MRQGHLYVCISDHIITGPGGLPITANMAGTVYWFADSDPGVPDPKLFSMLSACTATDSVAFKEFPSPEAQ